MRPAATILAALVSLTLTVGALAGSHQYGWSISDSTTDPFSNTGIAAGGVTTLYLWFECSTTDGIASAEFDISAVGISHLATTPMGGFLNAGGTSNLLLAVGGCPPGPTIAADLLVLDDPGELCIVASSMNGINGTVDCAPTPTIHGNTTNGYSNQGAPSCLTGDPLCQPDAVESASWGSVKSLYR